MRFDRGLDQQADPGNGPGVDSTDRAEESQLSTVEEERSWIMMWRVFIGGALLFAGAAGMSAQEKCYEQDPRLNNLVHPEGYVTGELGALGKVEKRGTGPRGMILVAGLGFSGEVFEKFAGSREDRFSIYAVTLPGFGKTPAPPMPKEGTSYGSQTWTLAAQRAVEELILTEKLDRPVLVGHWLTATQIVLGVALDRPDLVSAVVLISGVPKNKNADLQVGRALSLQERVRYVDEGMAPQWFKTVTRETWDDNNYYPHDYCIHPVRALQLWRQAHEPTLSVWIRYLCELWAQDVTTRLGDLQVPALVLKPGFDKDLYITPGHNYMKTFCHDSWEGVEAMSEKITMRTIPDSRVFIMDDQPQTLDREVDRFLSRLDEEVAEAK